MSQTTTEQTIREHLADEKKQLSQKPLPADTKPSVLRATHFIHEHLYNPRLHVAWVLEECEIRSSTFSQRFRVHHGHTPHEYIQHCRIDAACTLLESGIDNLFLIGMSVGYARYRTFLRNFKKITGRPPSEYPQNGRRTPRTEVRS